MQPRMGNQLNRMQPLARVACWCLLLLAPAALLADDPLPRKHTVELDPDTHEWVAAPTTEPGTPAGDLRIARALLSEDKPRRAKRAAQSWVKTWGADHELYPDAVLLEARARIAYRDYYDAHTVLQEFLNGYAGTAYEEPALELEFVVAEVFLSGVKRKFLGVRMLKADDIGLAILDDIAGNYPGTRLGELATLTKARYYFAQTDFPFAEQEYELLVQNYPRSRYTRPAMLQSARAALASFPGIQFDDAPLIEAEERFSRYLAQYPQSAEQENIGLILTDINETRAAKELSIGDYYDRVGQSQAAAFYYRSTLTHWPDTVAAIHAAERLADRGIAVGDAAAPPPPTESTPDDVKSGLNYDDPAARE